MNWKKEALEWGKALVGALVIVWLVHTFLFTMIRVDGKSMLETLQNGDRLFVTVADMRMHGPARGDIVICTYPGNDYLCVKRVIGLPGEMIEVREGVTYIDGAALSEEYVTHPKTYETMAPVEIGEDCYFVMGDNRAVSHDSRDPKVGTLKKDDIGGKVRFRVWPLSSVGSVTGSP